MNRYFYIVLISILTVIFSVSFYIYSSTNQVVETPKENTKEVVKKIENQFLGKTFVWLKSELTLNKEIITPAKTNAYAITFTDESNISIATDCNNGFGKYVVKDETINFGNITSTEKYCPDSQEGIFYNELISAEKFDLDSNGNLKIDFKIGTLFLKEVNSQEQVNGAKTNPLVGKEYSWLRTELKINKIILPKVAGKFKLSFSEDLKFTALTDCNTNGGTYILNENKLNFSETVATRMYCVNSQEEVFIRDLQTTSSYEILPDGTLILNLLDNSGRIYFK